MSSMAMATHPTSFAPEQCQLCDGPISRTKFLEIQARIRESEKQKLAEQRRILEVESVRVQQEANARADQRIAIAAKALAAAELRAKQVEASTDDRVRAAVEGERAAVREAMELQFQREKEDNAAANARAHEALQKKVDDFQRQLANKTASELGDAGEINLFEKLRDALPGDHVTRIAKGQPGADINIDVVHKGIVCGRILVDSKNRKAWQTGFATKLRADQIEVEADHAVLASTAFPSGK